MPNELTDYTDYLRDVLAALKKLDDYTDKHDTFGDLQSLNAEYSPPWAKGIISDALSKTHDMLEAAVGESGSTGNA